MNISTRHNIPFSTLTWDTGVDDDDEVDLAPPCSLSSSLRLSISILKRQKT